MKRGCLIAPSLNIEESELTDTFGGYFYNQKSPDLKCPIDDRPGYILIPGFKLGATETKLVFWDVPLKYQKTKLKSDEKDSPEVSIPRVSNSGYQDKLLLKNGLGEI